MALFWLSDEAWAAIEPHLPKNQPGARRVDDEVAWETCPSLFSDRSWRDLVRFAENFTDSQDRIVTLHIA